MLETANRVVVAVAVEEPIANSVVLVAPLFAWTESNPYGELVAIPNVPVVGSVNAVEVAGSVPKRRPPMLRPLPIVDEVAYA